MTVEDGRQQHKAISRKRDPEGARAVILAAATDEFAAHGLAGARVDAIAERAGFNKRMLYHYFGNKDDLYLAVLEEAYASIRAAENRLVLDRADPPSAIRELIAFTWTYFREHPEFLSLLATENVNRGRTLASSDKIRDLNSPLIGTLKTLLDRGASLGQFRRGIDPFMLYVSISALCFFYLANRWTLSTSFGRELDSAPEIDAWGMHVAEMILGYLRS